MTLEVSALVDARAHYSKKEHPSGKKTMPRGQGPRNEGNEKLRYREIRKEFQRTIAKAKVQSWEEFVTKEGNKEPWGHR